MGRCIRSTKFSDSANLAVFVAASVDRTGEHVALVFERLATDAATDSRNGAAACFWNRRVAVLAFFETLTLRQAVARKLHGVVDVGVDLLLDGAVLVPASRHTIGRSSKHELRRED